MHSSSADTPPDLFTPIRLGALELPNRIVMAPLTRNRASTGNVPGPMNVDYYRQRASAGLIITEGAQISARAVGYPSTPGIHSSEQIAGWQQVTSAVHERGGHIFLQLWHCGRVSHSSLLPDGMLPRAPSAITPAGEVMTHTGMQPYEKPHALGTDEITDIIEDYRQAARNALQAGFDGVEVHGANGYLLDQFLRDGSNQRQDEWGGPIENRARLLLTVTRAVCEIWGEERVGVRLSPLQPFNDIRDSDPRSTFRYVVEQLDCLNLAYLHVTEMGAEQPGAAGPGFDISELKKLWHGPYMINSNYSFKTGTHTINTGKADLVSFGRSYIANPDLVERFRLQAPLNEPDPDTFYGGDARGYTDYPTLQQSSLA